MKRRIISLLVLVLVMPAMAARPRGATASACEFEGVDRIVAVGDVHGAYDQFVEILRIAGILDDRGRWSAGRTHFVQLGDVVDRGPDSRKALDLLQRLTGQASAAGGRVHSLMGNHEAMRLLGDLRYVTPGEYAAFATDASDNVRRQAIESKPADQREQLLKETPLGAIEMIRAFGPNGAYGSRVRTLDAVVRINGILFLHGGISPAVSTLPCATINATVQRDLTTDIQKTLAAPLDTLTFGADGPLWYRGLAEEPETFRPTVDGILAAQHAKAIVVGHTVQPGGRIVARFSNQVFLIDTGMQPAYVPDGRASALEISGGRFTAITRDGRQVLAGAR